MRHFYVASYHFDGAFRVIGTKFYVYFTFENILKNKFIKK